MRTSAWAQTGAGWAGPRRRRGGGWVRGVGGGGGVVAGWGGVWGGWDWRVRGLTLASVGVDAWFLVAMGEFAGEGRGAPDDDTMIGQEIRVFGACWAAPGAFGKY